ncbi:hypothetical protein K491DRAFT_697333 [Lophiostoma macrostomum CBS 122681]|uniref:Uncharacterized protein n=1 Tax=Lophiostoma macrostomum CBS 122681 TaxID=1314788 RepID=A0A6A6SRR7_9PLEO|nr:hypothetical protein K491DRAFT_697333 [Lophiostoma macrostomum CBS 122681]
MSSQHYPLSLSLLQVAQIIIKNITGGTPSSGSPSIYHLVFLLVLQQIRISTHSLQPTAYIPTVTRACPKESPQTGPIQPPGGAGQPPPFASPRPRVPPSPNP